MNPTDAVARALQYNKEVFQSTYDTMVFWQDQTQKAVDTLCDRNAQLAKETKKFTDEWIKVYKAGRESFKKNADDAFNGLEAFFTNSHND